MVLTTGRMIGLAARASMAVALSLALPALDAGAPRSCAGSPQTAIQSAKAKTDGHPAKGVKSKLGVTVNNRMAFQGYTLLAPMSSTKTFLIDMAGRVVRTWQSDCYPGQSAYLLENGHLLRAGHLDNHPFGFAPGRGGRVQEFTWDGELVWDFRLATTKQLRHHDVCKLPNGNVLLIVWEKKTAKEVAAAGAKAGEPCFVDCVLEVRPTGKTTGEIVWEWHFWDHLLQDHDKTKANYGEVAAHPELIDINFHGRDTLFASLVKKKDELAKLQALGYVGTPPPGMKHFMPDWTHINSVAYNADLDQIMLSVHEYGEVWIIDHSTTTAEAASHKGGRRGMGGDLLYRWGNPRSYRAGVIKDQQLFFQHDANWIARGLPGEGHILVFNNGLKRPAGNYSSVDEIVPPLDKQGRYVHKAGSAYGPGWPAWSYTAPQKMDFFARIMSGAHRLPNGNTLICSSTGGAIFEVTPDKETVWKYLCPPLQSSLMRGILQKVHMQVTAEQTKQLEELQKQVTAKLDEVLTDHQKELLKKAQNGFENFPLAGRIMLPFFRGELKLTADQKELMAQSKKKTIGELSGILEKEQLGQVQKMLRAFRSGGPGSSGKGAGSRRIAPAVGGSFRAYRYAPTYPGLVGRDLTPGSTLEVLYAKEEQSR